MTTRPKSLLQFAQAPAHPSPLDRSSLVLIDHQREYLPDGGVPLEGIEDAVTEIGRLLHLARQSGMPVFHVVHHGRPGSALFDPQGEAARIIAGLEPVEGEQVVAKSLPNAFAGTELESHLRGTGRPEIIVAGFATHMCVSSTVRAALDRGFRTTLVAAATATRNLPDPLDQDSLVRAEAVQAAALAALADRFAVVARDSVELSSC